MRSLSATLEAAQKKPDRLPYVEAKVYDFEQGIKRLLWTRLYTGSEADNYHGVAFDGQRSMHRIRADINDRLYRQKITNPDGDSDYTSWTEIATDCQGPCAIAAYGAKVYIFYRTTSNVLWKLYSHNYGDTWSSAQFVDYAAVLSMAATWWGTTDIVVCFALTANELNGIVLDSSTQATSQHIKTFHQPSDVHHLIYTYGIGATFNAFWPCCEIVFAAQESDIPYNYYALYRTKFYSDYTFLAIESFLMAPVGEDITYEYPDCHRPASPQDYENTRIVAIEKFAGISSYTRPLTCHLVKGGDLSDAIFTEPKPFLDLSSNRGLRLSTTTDYWWMERPDGVWRAPRSATDPLDLTKDIIALSQSSSSSPSLIITLDNSKGQYATPGSGALAVLKKRSEVVLKLGYKTTAGNESSEAGTYWIDGWQYLSNLNQSLFIIHCLDGWGLAARWSARYQMRWNKDAVGPKSVWQILYLILCRFGIRLTNTPPKPQSSAINNFYPDFTIEPGTSGTQALKKLLSFVPDKLVFRGQEAFTKNPLADESSSYSYCSAGSCPPPMHVIVAGQYSDHVPLSRARAIGRTAAGARIVEDAFDWNLLELAIDALSQDYDPNLDNQLRTQERADAILRTESLRAQRGNLTIPTNCGQELLDVITVTDERCGISSEKYRVEAIQTLYKAFQGSYTQRLSLCAP